MSTDFSRRAILAAVAGGPFAANTARAAATDISAPSGSTTSKRTLRLSATIFRMKGSFQYTYDLARLNSEEGLVAQATSQGLETLFQRELRFSEGAPVALQKIDFIPTIEAFSYDADTSALTPINSYMTTEITVSASKSRTDGSSFILDNAILRYQDAVPSSRTGSRAFTALPMYRAALDIRDTIKIPFAKPKLIFGLVARNDDSKDAILFALCASLITDQG